MELFDAIIQANKGLDGRVQGIQWGVVAKTDDPMSLDRIQVLEASKGGKSLSDWLMRILPFPGFSPPLPVIGETILIGYIDGDPHKGAYFGVAQNMVNPNIHNKTDLVIQIGSVFLQIKPDGVLNISGLTGVNIDSESVAFSGVSSVSIDGKQVVTLGGVDNKGHILVDRGW